MAAGVVRLRTRGDQLKAEQAEQLRQAVLRFPDLPEHAAGQIIAAIDRQTAAENGWSFVMLSPAQNRVVVKWLGQHSKRPAWAMQLWSELFLHLRRDTGEIVLTRDELAEAVGIEPRHVSEIMGELEELGAISRQRVKVPGMRGPGVARYFMSARIATHTTGATRDKAQAAAPALRVVP